MNRDDLVIEVRDVNLERVDVVNPLTAMFAPRHLGVGTWELTIPADDRTADAFKAKGSGVVVTAPWGTVMSGSRTGYRFIQSGKDPVGQLKITGVDDKAILWRHTVFPDPANAADAQTAGYFVRNEVAETLIHELVNVNVGPGAHSSRRSVLEGALVLGTDLGRGGTYRLNSRFDNLGDVLASIASQHGLGFTVVQDGDDLEFETFAVVDRSAFIRLNVVNGTLSSLEVSESAPSTTAAMVLGQGEGADRTIRVTRDLVAEADWGWVSESVRDRRDTDDPNLLDQAGVEDITDGAEKVTPKVIPTEALSMAYGTDWREGDLVAVGAGEIKETVSGAVIRVDRKSVRTAAKVGEA